MCPPIRVQFNISLSGLTAFTISFWGRLSYGVQFDIISSLYRAGDDYLSVVSGYRVNGGKTYLCTFRSPQIPESLSKYDIIVDGANGVVKTYENGILTATSSVSISTLFTNLIGLTTAKLFKVYACNENDLFICDIWR